MNLFAQVQRLIATTLKVSPQRITETTLSEHLAAWDSVGHVNVMIALEESFDILLEVEDFPKLISVPAIVKYLQDQGIN